MLRRSDVKCDQLSVGVTGVLKNRSHFVYDVTVCQLHCPLLFFKIQCVNNIHNAKYCIIYLEEGL